MALAAPVLPDLGIIGAVNFDYDADFDALLRLLVELVEADGGHPLPEGQAWLNDRQWIAKKFCYHLASMAKLRQGSTFRVGDQEHPYIDHSSIAAIGRAALENAIVFGFIFGHADLEVSRFRDMAWRYAGLMDRQNRPALSHEARAKQLDELPEIHGLLAQLRSHSEWKALSAGQQKAITVRAEWKMGWKLPELVRYAGLSEAHYRTMYGYLSDYSHTSYAAALQVGQADPDVQGQLARTTAGMMCPCMAHFAHIFAKGSARAASVLEHSSVREVAERWRLGP